MVNYVKGLVGLNKKEDPQPQAAQKSEPEKQAPNYEEYMEMASQGLEHFKKKGSQLIVKAKECDLTQHKVISASRVAFDATAISLGPVGCAIGGAVGVLDKETTTQVCDKINKATEGVWRDLSFERKLLTLGSGVGIGIFSWYVYIPLFTYIIFTVANVYAAKRGADLALNHWNSEAEIDRQKKLLEDDQVKTD